MAAGDTINGVGGRVSIAGGADYENVKKWSKTKTFNKKKYAVSGSRAKRSVNGTYEETGTIEIELEEGERPALADGDRLEVDLKYDATSYFTGFITIDSVAEGVNMDDGQVDTLVINWSADGALTPTGALAGGGA